METGVVEDRNQVIQELFSGLHRVNRKAKMVLELLGFRSAAALPEHLHAAVLQVLLMGPVVGPFCRRSLLPLATRGAAAEPLPLRSEGCVIQCLFADWLTKTSKWLKVPRYRYVMLLSVAPTPEQEEGRQPITRNNSTSKPTASVAEEIPQAQGEQTEFAGLKQKKRHCPQLLLVTFKAPQGPLSNSGHESVDFNVLQKAEPSEVFSIDSTHVSSIMLHLQDYRTLPAQVTVLGKAFTGVPTSITYIGVHLHVCASVAFQRALCQRIPCGEDTQLVLVVEGLGGRLLILGEFSRSAASLSGTTGVQVSGSSPLEQLAHIINEAAPLCAAPRPSRWRRLLQLFAATATAVDLGESTAIPAFRGNSAKQCGRANEAHRETESTTGCWQVNCSSSKEASAAREEQQTVSLVALLLRFSVAACFAICRPLTLVMRHCSSRSATPRRPRAGRGTAAAPDMPRGGCNNCGLDPNSLNSIHCTKHGHSCACARRAQCTRISSGQRISSPCVARPQRTLRQLIDDQQRTLATLAVREYRRKVALVQHEYQMSRQHASRALMDEHGQLFPQARRWLDSTDGKLLMLCLTGRSWRPTAGPRS